MNDITFKDKKPLKGIYLVEKVQDRIRLKADTDVVYRIFDYFKFETLLFQSFDREKIDKILYHLNCSEKLLIDFTLDKAKLIIKDDKDIDKFICNYMNSKYVDDVKNGFIEDTEATSFETL